MWRDGEGKREARPQRPVLGPKLQPGGNTCSQNERAQRGNQPIRRAYGTIDVRSNGDIITSDEDERRAPLRPYNIRRSKALERRNG
jgi:hypothetical protein